MPAHPVAIDTGFWLARTEVTIDAYRRFAARHGIKPPEGDGRLPLTGLPWARAKAYCADVGGRLPTEAEWEYAARGGATTSYYGELTRIAWFTGNSNGVAHPVGTKQANAFGLFDMLGNVLEWVLDRYYKKYYVDSPPTGSGVDQPLAGNASAVGRGGSFEDEAGLLRLSRRFELPNDEGLPTVGFRCASDRR